MSKSNRESHKELPAIEFKSTSLSAISVVLRSLNMAELEVTMAAMPGNRKRFFDGDGAVLDLGAVAGQTADWPALMALLQGHGVQPLAVCDADEALIATAAMEAGLPCVAASDLARPRKAAEKAAPPVSTAPPAAPTLIVDKPLRSGQRVYAQGGDLVLTAMVSAGAEVIADGSIHIYAPLRGKALAGATGNANARVFCTCFEAELVSVAGVYRTFENGVPEKHRSLPVSLWLEGNDGKPTLRLESLALR